MPFKPLLNALVERVPGAQGAIIADWEGESVDQVGIMDDYDPIACGTWLIGSVMTSSKRS
jgi:hypothetical protein